MRRPTVRNFMTLGPVVVGSDLPLAEAHRLMRERNIRHLPVVDAGCLVGLVSQRDLYLCGTLVGVDPVSAPVREAMTPEPYAVDPDAALEEVAETMARRKLGSAVVVEHGQVVGLFTTVDALRALSGLVRRRGRRGEPAGEPTR